MANKPVLYYLDLSPPSRAVLLTAATIGVELELKVVDLLAGDNLTPEFIKARQRPRPIRNTVCTTHSHSYQLPYR